MRVAFNATHPHLHVLLFYFISRALHKDINFHLILQCADMLLCARLQDCNQFSRTNHAVERSHVTKQCAGRCVASFQVGRKPWSHLFHVFGTSSLPRGCSGCRPRHSQGRCRQHAGGEGGSKRGPRGAQWVSLLHPGAARVGQERKKTPKKWLEMHRAVPQGAEKARQSRNLIIYYISETSPEAFLGDKRVQDWVSTF